MWVKQAPGGLLKLQAQGLWAFVRRSHQPAEKYPLWLNVNSEVGGAVGQSLMHLPHAPGLSLRAQFCRSTLDNEKRNLRQLRRPGGTK